MEKRIALVKKIVEECSDYLGFVESSGNEDAWCDRCIENIKKYADEIEEFNIVESDVSEMKKYKVHFSGYYGYTVGVNAISEEYAIDIAESIFDTIDPAEFDFERAHTDVWEEE